MRVVVAGTFGPIHDGHRALFEAALRHGTDGVVVALTDDELAQQTRSEPRPVPRFEERERQVRSEFAEIDEWDREIEIRALHDEHGIARSDSELDAIVVSPETEDEVVAINEQRREGGLDPLEPIVVPFVLAEDGERISSTRIVAGEIDEHGNVLDSGDH